MSAFGERLKLPIQGTGTEVCPNTGDVYQLDGKNLKRIAVALH
jgi:hypothetical protein